MNIAGDNYNATVDGSENYYISLNKTYPVNGEFSINIDRASPTTTPIKVYQELNSTKSKIVEVYVKLTSNFSVNKIKLN